VSTKSDIAVRLPRELQLSNPPMKGSFKIKCALDKDGNVWNTTAAMDYAQTYENSIVDNIVKVCPNYRDKITVYFGNKYNYIEDGRDILIRFYGLNYDIPQFQILSDIDVPIEGNSVTFNSTTW
jgi:hypothetical protein